MPQVLQHMAQAQKLIRPHALCSRRDVHLPVVLPPHVAVDNELPNK